MINFNGRPKDPDASPEHSQEESPPPQIERSTLSQPERKPHTTTKEEAPLLQLEKSLQTTTREEQKQKPQLTTLQL